MYAHPSSHAGLYVPIHKRTPSSTSSSASPPPSPSPSTSPSSSTRSLSPLPPHITIVDDVHPHPHAVSDSHPNIPIYTPTDLLLLASSPLAAPSPALRDALRSTAPEIVQSRRQRKAAAWHTRHSSPGSRSTSSSGSHEAHGYGKGHKRTSSYPSHADEDTWRRV